MIVRITDLDDLNINVEVEDDVIDTNYVINKTTCQVFAKGTAIVISFWNPRDINLSATQLVYDESVVEDPPHTDVDDLVDQVRAFLATGGGGDPLGYYGSWQDNVTQTAAASNTGYAMIFRTEDVTPNGVSIVSNGTNPTRITFANTGIYNVQFSSQFQNTDNAEHDVTIWLRLNGVDVAGSSGFVQVPKRKSAGAGNEGHCIPSWNYLLSVVAGEYYEIVWSTTDHTHITMQFYAAGSPPPSAASVILSVTQQSGIMAGTGITAINSITEAAQTLGVGTSGTDFAVSSSGSAHTLNLPTASASNRGALSSANWTTFNGKQDSSLSPLRIKNRWHIPSELGFSLATGSLVLNNIYALAVRFTEATTITDIGFIATSGVPGALANIGIYDSNSLGEPNNLVASASNINITSSGSKSVTLGSPVVLPVGKYWFAIFSSATISVTSSGISSLAGIGNATLVATTVTAILKGLTFTALPNPFGAYSTTNQANVPFVWFKTS
jgi:hypothetical protein